MDIHPAAEVLLMPKNFLRWTLISGLCLGISACTALRSTMDATMSNIDAFVGSPRKIGNKITNPYRPDARLAVLWVGHATALIQIDDKFILTDPVLMNTVGQFSKRLVEPGIDPENLPGLDAVLISHMHIDHLSPASLNLIKSKIHQLLIPAGGIVYIPDFDFPINELSKWQVWEKDGLRITAVPSVHNGWRYGLDAAWMKTSYTGYIIEYNGIKVHFAGDTAYDPELFHEIGRHFPNIDLTLVPIAPIHPRVYSKSRHTDPFEAIRIYKDLGARFLTPIHFDTFPESADTLGEATAVLHKAMEENSLTGDQVVILTQGEQHVYIRRVHGIADSKQ
jgi:N-acyl-phosphatidylethanolamine-hydrolysing phospholipase D